MVTFSIIVPVYKVEEYLDRCVMSLVEQDYDKQCIEIILVDDGSPDDCGKKCDEFAEQFDFIKALHKENGGLSDARNYGLSYARNDYILYVDSDDYIERDTCKVFSKIIEENAEEVDLCTGGFIRHLGDEMTVFNTKNLPDKPVSGRKYLLDRLTKNSFIVTAWANAYKRSFLINNELLFCKGRLHEDEEFTPRAFLVAKRIASSDYAFYHYIIRDNSITTSKNKVKNALDIFDTVNSLHNLYTTIDDIKLRNMLLSHSAKICFRAIEEGQLYKKENEGMINYSAIKKNCVYSKEIIRYVLLKINPMLMHDIYIRFNGET